jgi:hypothetical protein
MAKPILGEASRTFVKEGHKYTVDGQEVQRSCTGVIGHFFPPFDSTSVMSQWYHKWKSSPDHPYYAAIQEALAGGLGDAGAKAAITALWAESGELGTALHYHIECILNNLLPPLSLKLAPEIAQFHSFMASDFVTSCGLKPYRTELIVSWSADGRCVSAGMIDALFVDANHCRYLIDWKRIGRNHELSADREGFGSSTGLGPMAHLPNTDFSRYSLQCSIYNLMLKQSYGIDVGDRMYLVRMHTDRTEYELKQCSDLRDEALTALRYELQCLVSSAPMPSPLLPLEPPPKIAGKVRNFYMVKKIRGYWAVEGEGEQPRQEEWQEAAGRDAVYDIIQPKSRGKLENRKNFFSTLSLKLTAKVREDPNGAIRLHGFEIKMKPTTRSEAVPVTLDHLRAERHYTRTIPLPTGKIETSVTPNGDVYSTKDKAITNTKYTPKVLNATGQYQGTSMIHITWQPSGYPSRQKYHIAVHRLVLTVFGGPPPSDRHQADHINGECVPFLQLSPRILNITDTTFPCYTATGDPTNNNISNLQWLSIEEHKSKTAFGLTRSQCEWNGNGLGAWAHKTRSAIAQNASA